MKTLRRLSRTSALKPALCCILIAAGACDGDTGPGQDPSPIVADGGDLTGGGSDDAGTLDSDDLVEQPRMKLQVSPRFDPTHTGFYRMPWPADYRTVDGVADLSDVMGREAILVQRYIDTLSEVRGFSTMPVAIFPFELPDDESIRDAVAQRIGEAIPDAASSLTPAGTLQLVELGAGCGNRTPIEAVFEAEGDRYTAPFVLQVGVVPGYVLKPQTTYAFLIGSEFGAAADIEVAAAGGFADALSGTGSDSELVASYQPLRDCLETAGVSPSSIAVATVFTTQDPVTETRLLREVVMSESVDSPVISDWAEWVEESEDQPYIVWKGTYETPHFQRGDSPFTNEGGGLEFVDGLPVVQKYETVPFTLTLPRDVATTLPVLVWSDGTGADLSSPIGDTHLVEALNRGFAIATFAPQFHDARRTPGSSDELSTFNYVNPEAGRTVFRQQAADTSYFVRVIQEAIPGQMGVPSLKTDKLVYGGHSQGALVGAIVAGVESVFESYALNGVGSYLSETIVSRADPFDINIAIQQLLGVDQRLDRYHIVVQLAQLGADVVDPHNYARAWRGWEGHPRGSSVFLTNGKADTTTSTTSMNALIRAANVMPIGSVGWDIDPLGLWDDMVQVTPLAGNETSFNGQALTYATICNLRTGHFTIYDARAPRQAFVGFWQIGPMGYPTLSLE
jgi:hypothetical protein